MDRGDSISTGLMVAGCVLLVIGIVGEILFWATKLLRSIYGIS